MLLVLMRCKRDALPQERDLAPRLEKMLEYLLFSVTPAGTVPTWGDTDYGKALGLGLEKDFWDVRPLLSTGAALFNRADMKYVAQNLDPKHYGFSVPTRPISGMPFAPAPPNPLPGVFRMAACTSFATHGLLIPMWRTSAAARLGWAAQGIALTRIATCSVLCCGSTDSPCLSTPAPTCIPENGADISA